MSKGVFYEGEELDAEEIEIEDMLADIERAVEGLPAEIDLYCDEPADLLAKLARGDDFAHWTLRYGCVLFDSGVLREAAVYTAERDLWPDPERKLRQARRTLDFAERLLASGDHAAAIEQVRGALSLTARWWLLAHDVFPLARAELPAQLRALTQPALACALEAAIHELPDMEDLGTSVATARTLTG